MVTVNIHAAKTHLSRLVDEAAAGRDIVIAEAGKSVARLEPLRGVPASPRVLGRVAGQLTVPTNFDAPLPDAVLDAFEGR